VDREGGAGVGGARGGGTHLEKSLFFLRILGAGDLDL
jgi:hypothetical protein